VTRAWPSCAACGTDQPFDTRLWRCPCGAPLIIKWDKAPDPTLPADVRPVPGQPGLWRYRAALPIHEDAAIVTLGEGMTPLVEARLEGRPVLYKCDFCCPTGSFKDRGWTVAVSHLREIGVRSVTEDSSGNAGASLAAYGARAGITVTVFVPADASTAKKRQIAACGARVVEVSGGRAELERQARDTDEDTFYAGHSWNPWFIEGTRTLAWEILEQTGGVMPAAVVTPLSQGAILLGLWQGFEVLRARRGTPTPPRLIAAQPAACAPVVLGLRDGSPQPPPVVPGPSLADGIRSPAPVRYAEIVAALRASNGTALAIGEDGIALHQRKLAHAGFFVEPTSAVAAAAAAQWLASEEAAHRTPDGPVVIVLTGHGLKRPPD